MAPPRRELSIAPGTRVELTSVRVARTVEARVDRLLGAGGTALVYAGELADGTHVVLKTPRWEGVVDAGFELELELFKQFAHRNIVHCVGTGELGGQRVVAFRRAYENPLLLMTKGSVDEGMRRDKKALYPSLPLDAAIDLGYELLNALEYVERIGYVHHDVKLANLLIDIAPKERPLEGNEVFGRVVRRDYRGVLIDFGAARSREYLEAYNRGQAPPGLTPQITPFYAPPEALVEARRPDGSLGLVFDPSIDVYAAALVLYAMITGHPPYSHLRTPVDPRDLESVIAVKSAERRGEIETVSQEVLQRVVFEDTRFVGGDRAAWDLACYRFLAARLAPDPARRGTAAQMKKDFEQLMQIRAARDEAGPRETGSRVFLPFTQELVKVGSAGEHPLLRAARLYVADAKADRASDRPPAIERGALSKSGEWRAPDAAPEARVETRPASRPAGGEPGAGLGWLDDAGEAAAPRAGAPPGQARGTRRHVRQDLAARAASSPDARAASSPDARAASSPDARAASSPDARRPASSPPSERTAAAAERAAAAAAAAAAAERATGGAERTPRPASASGLLHTQTQARQATEAATPPPDADPATRPPPRPERAALPHVLVSAVLDEPLLLSREKRTVIGRDGTAEVRIKSDLVSRRHAEIAWNGAGFVVSDLGSVNGTLVNGVRLGGPCLLHGDDRISVAGFEVVVRVLAPGDAPERPTEGGGTTRLLRPEVAKALVRESLGGELGPLGLRDVVDMLEWKKHSGTLTVTPAPGGPGPGRLFVKSGVVVHAETKAGRKGLEAALELLRIGAGRFSFAPGKPRCPATITCGNDDLWGRVGPPPAKPPLKPG